MRLFVALRPPAAVRDMLLDTMEGVVAARWQEDDQLHLTLRFLGNVESAVADDVAAALGGIVAPVPRVRIAGVGRFKDTLWAGVHPQGALAALHHKVDHACVRAGLTPERRAYLPHVTLARFARSAAGDPALARWIADHAALGSEPFDLPHLILYESVLGRGGATYEPLMRWPLGTAAAMGG